MGATEICTGRGTSTKLGGGLNIRLKSNRILPRLKPASTDEIGYLTQTLSKVFRRLGDQETHMRTIVDTAAEGIIVVDEKGLIDTFNQAAERLFAP